MRAAKHIEYVSRTLYENMKRTYRWVYIIHNTLQFFVFFCQRRCMRWISGRCGNSWGNLLHFIFSRIAVGYKFIILPRFFAGISIDLISISAICWVFDCLRIGQNIHIETAAWCNSVVATVEVFMRIHELCWNAFVWNRTRLSHCRTNLLYVHLKSQSGHKNTRLTVWQSFIKFIIHACNARVNKTKVITHTNLRTLRPNRNVKGYPQTECVKWRIAIWCMSNSSRKKNTHIYETHKFRNSNNNILMSNPKWPKLWKLFIIFLFGIFFRSAYLRHGRPSCAIWMQSNIVACDHSNWAIIRNWLST